jgi:hypothetical protein
LSNSSLLNINSLHLNFLRPLETWRILDLKNLREECDYSYNSRSFERVIVKLQKCNVVKSFKDPLSNRKFVYLSSLGEKLVGTKNGELNEETMFHDSRVSQIVRELLKRDCFIDFKLEHLIGAKSQAYIPDAKLTGIKKRIKFKVAFELELTRKTKERVRSKIGHYLRNSDYDYIIYMFCNKGVMNSYKKTIKDEFGEKAFDRVLLFTNESIMTRNMKLNESYGYFKNREVCIEELF